MKNGENVWKRYWSAYGGYKALFTSYYLIISFVISAFFFPLWTSEGWWNDVFQIVPSLLGFSLGGYAMWIAFGDSSFRQIISGGSENKASPFMEVSAAFVHFMIVQMLAIMIALFAKAVNFSLSTDSWIFTFLESYYYYKICQFASYLGFSIFVYALLSTIAAVMALFRAAHWYDTFQENKSKP